MKEIANNFYNYLITHQWKLILILILGCLSIAVSIIKIVLKSKRPNRR